MLHDAGALGWICPAPSAAPPRLLHQLCGQCRADANTCSWCRGCPRVRSSTQASHQGPARSWPSSESNCRSPRAFGASRMLDVMAKPRRRGSQRTRRTPRVIQTQHETRDAARSPQPHSGQSVTEILERLKRGRSARDEAEVALDALVDRAVDLGIGWPEIAAQLGVTRQAARQRYQRRHRSG